MFFCSRTLFRGILLQRKFQLSNPVWMPCRPPVPARITGSCPVLKWDLRQCHQNGRVPSLPGRILLHRWRYWSWTLSQRTVLSGWFRNRKESLSIRCINYCDVILFLISSIFSQLNKLKYCANNNFQSSLGFYNSKLGLSKEDECEPCPPGYYCPRAGMEECCQASEQCDPGFNCILGVDTNQPDNVTNKVRSSVVVCILGNTYLYVSR